MKTIFKIYVKYYIPFSTKLFLFILLWTFLPVQIFSQDKFTIDQVMSSGFPSNLTTASSGDFAAWVTNKKGVRNIYVSGGSLASTKMVTSYTLDDGQVISNLIFSSDNKDLFYVKGGAPNRKGEIPNPLSLPEKTKREIWKINLKNNSVTLVSEGHSPSLSHQGKLLVFINKGQVWQVDLTSGEKPKQLFSIRGRVGTLTWSPDDSKLAFQSNRSDHSYIGIYQLVTKSINYIAPSVDYDSNPVWAPDSKRIAFIRTPREAENLPFLVKRSAIPWRIYIGDTKNDHATEIWRASEGMGSAFRFISAANQLFWTDNELIVFPWEGDGWIHLYSIKTDGSKLSLLTPGKAEIQFVSISDNRKQIFYSSNQGDIDRQHIWKVTLDNNKTKQISQGKGIEWLPKLSASNNKLFILASQATIPAHPAVLENGIIKSLMPKSDLSEFPNKDLVQPEQVVFTAADGMQIHGQLFSPPKVKKGEKYPAVIFLHGGSRRQMLLGFHHSGSLVSTIN